MDLRSVSLLLFLGVAASCSKPEPPALDGQKIMRTLLAFEAKRGGACVALATNGTAFDEIRSEMQQAKQPLVGFWGWQRLGHEGSSAPGSPALRQRLQDASTAVIAAPPPRRRLVERIDPSWIPQPLQPQGHSKSCTILTFSSPATKGNLSFVDVGSLPYACGSQCRSKEAVALERRGTDWQPVAAVMTRIN
jgi:hypothetical protein